MVTVPPEPLWILHAPVPIVAELAARATDVSPQVEEPVWSSPAAAVVGVCDTVICSTFEATAPVQSAMQLTRASRLYQVDALRAPGA